MQKSRVIEKSRVMKKSRVIEKSRVIATSDSARNLEDQLFRLKQVSKDLE